MDVCAGDVVKARLSAVAEGGSVSVGDPGRLPLGGDRRGEGDGAALTLSSGAHPTAVDASKLLPGEASTCPPLNLPPDLGASTRN